MFLTLSCVLPVFAEVLIDRPFQDSRELTGLYGLIKGKTEIAILQDGTKALEIAVSPEEAKAKRMVSIHMAGKTIAGRSVVFSAEIKCDMGLPVRKWGGGQFVVWAPAVRQGEKFLWEHRYVGAGKKGWRHFEMEVTFPEKVSHALLQLGISGARGKIYYRNVKAESGGALVPLAALANMGFADKTAGDRQGGWHDQGSDTDASSFPVKNRTFANVPFSIVDPATNGGKSILVFQCPKLPKGLKEAAVALAAKPEGRYLYLLHCSAWGQPANTLVGTVLLEGEGAKQVEIPLIYGKDVAEWWGAKPKDNAVVGVNIAANRGVGAAYVSRFDIPAGFGPISKVTFQKEPNSKAMWMLIAATISQTKYQYPKQEKLTTKADHVWKQLPQNVIPAPKAGSALDLSSLYPAHRVGDFGRVVIGKGGHFEFEKAPGKPVRFMSVGMGRDFGAYFGVPEEMKDKEMIERYVDQMHRAGYNMVRFWASKLKTDGDSTKKEGWRHNKAFEFSPSVVDRVDYFFYCLKKKGIYIFLSIGDACVGYDNCYPWGKKGTPLEHWDLYTNQKDFDAWCKGTTLILNHVNPYTKQRWLDDPIIAMIDCNNEQEFAFIRADKRYDGLFQQFLKAKYTDFAALKTAWGRDAEKLNGFADIRNFQPLGKDQPGQLNKDRAEFVTAQEVGLYERERAHIRKLGYSGPVTTFLMGKSMRHVGVRKNFDFVAQNGYHAHPHGGVITKSSIAQISSIGSAANTVRSFLAARPYGKPLVVTEHGHVFWNKYRYEQGFVMGGLSALNAFDGLTAFFMPVTTHPNQRITSFEMRHDPILRAAELMTGLMYRRRDVKTSDLATRIRLNLDDVIGSNAVTDGINSTQLRLGLIGQCYVDQTTKPVQPHELVMERVGGSSTSVRRADSNVVDSANSAFDLQKTIRRLKAQSWLRPGNQTDADHNVFESSTGELLIKANSNFMKIETGRFQGICAEAGSQSKLENLEIKSMSRRGCIALASIDGEKSLDEADRLLLFIVTNVLNSGMVFENADQRTRLKIGTTPLLLETGQFDLSIMTREAKNLHLYALALDGTRLAELPVKKTGNRLDFSIDTGTIPGGPSVYFELCLLTAQIRK
jgi:hypothetical protein